jgi:hypothetical protein
LDDNQSQEQRRRQSAIALLLNVQRAGLGVATKDRAPRCCPNVIDDVVFANAVTIVSVAFWILIGPTWLETIGSVLDDRPTAAW